MPKTKSHPRRRSRADRALAASMLEKLRAGEDVRAAKVRRLRGAIRNRTYENSLKLEICIDRLLADLCE